MPSPFPGMAPYLENPLLWPDFHHSLAGQTRDQLNSALPDDFFALPDDFFALMEQCLEVGIVDDIDENESVSRYIPDGWINSAPWSERSQSTALIAQP